MKKNLLGISFVVLLTIGGCSALTGQQGLAPSKLDQAGQPIPGTHTLSPEADATTKQIPYGEMIAVVLLGAYNIYEKIRADKSNKALKSTFVTIEKAGEEPATATAIAALKNDLSTAHQIAGVKPLVNDILAKI